MCPIEVNIIYMLIFFCAVPESEPKYEELNTLQVTNRVRSLSFREIPETCLRTLDNFKCKECLA